MKTTGESSVSLRLACLKVSRLESQPSNDHQWNHQLMSAAELSKNESEKGLLIHQGLF